MPCLRPEYVYKVASYNRDDNSSNFEVQDLRDSMDHFWLVYDEERFAGPQNGYEHGHVQFYEQMMGMYRGEAITATDTYLDQMQSLDAISGEFIEVCDPGQWHVARHSDRWFAKNGTKLSPRAAFARELKSKFLSIFKRMIPFHAEYNQ